MVIQTRTEVEEEEDWEATTGSGRWEVGPAGDVEKCGFSRVVGEAIWSKYKKKFGRREMVTVRLNKSSKL